MFDSSYPKGMNVRQISWELERMNEEQRKAFIKANSDAYETIIDKTRRYIQCMTHQCKNCIYEKECFKNNDI